MPMATHSAKVLHGKQEARPRYLVELGYKSHFNRIIVKDCTPSNHEIFLRICGTIVLYFAESSSFNSPN
jgi:hypothetical protein